MTYTLRSIGNQNTAKVYGTLAEAMNNKTRFIRSEIFETETGKIVYTSVLASEKMPKNTHTA